MSYDSDQVVVDNPAPTNGQIDYLGYTPAIIDTTDSPYTTGDVVVILAKSDTGAIAINLTTKDNTANTTYIVKRVDGSVNDITLAPPAGETINAAATLTLTHPNEIIQVMRNADNVPPDWEIISSDTTLQLTAKGDILSYNGTTTETIPVGPNGYVLVADAAESSGLKWIAATSLTTKIAYHIITMAVSITATTWTDVAYFSWDYSRYSTYFSGTVTFWAEAAVGRTFDIRVTDRTKTTTYGSVTVNSTGIWNLSLTSLPVADDYLIISAQRDANISADPILISAQMEFLV